MILDHLLEGNRRFGSTKEDICRSLFVVEPNAIHKKVVLAPWWQPAIFESHVLSITPIVQGVCDIWDVLTQDGPFTYIKTSIGANRIMDATLALACTPCEKVIFIGSVAGLHADLGIGDIVIPRYSICGEGASRYLTVGKLADHDCFGEKSMMNEGMFDFLCAITEKMTKPQQVKWHIGRTFSVDSIVAEFVHIDEILGMDCNSLEMETAAFLRSAQVAGLQAGIVMSVSDNIMQNKSLFSGRSEEEQQYRKDVRQNVLTKIVLEALFI